MSTRNERTIQRYIRQGRKSLSLVYDFVAKITCKMTNLRYKNIIASARSFGKWFTSV